MLAPRRIRRIYDRLGSSLDSQAFYEDRALAELVAALDLAGSRRVVELGCGTGRLAERLLAEHLPETATYAGFDLSPKMVEISKRRLARFGARARVTLTDGVSPLPLPVASCDRFVSTYVLDLLEPEHIGLVLGDARRLLAADGRLGLASLTFGRGAGSRTLIGIWRGLFRLAPSLVGGCRPIELERFVTPPDWSVVHHGYRVAWGVPTEIVVATPRASAGLG
jgi:ubiquinone/menaquinone biosynthesis C-methylase UbiE